MKYPPHKQLVPWTPVGQLRTWAPDETYTAERTLECGQACLVSIFRWATGLWIPAAYLHDLVHAPGQTTGTTLQQMVDTCHIMETNATLHFPNGIGELEALILENLNQDHPIIQLRHLFAPGDGIGHFCVITGYSTGRVQLMDPWTGAMFTQSWQKVFDFYEGACIVVRRKRMLGNH